MFPEDVQVFTDMSNAAYHDCKDVLSSSMIRQFLKPGGPEKLRKRQGETINPTTARFGTLAHAWNLEGVAPVPVPKDYKTTTSLKFKKWLVEQFDMSIDPADIDPNQVSGWCTGEEYERLKSLHEVFINSLKTVELLGVGRPEVSVFWTDPATGVRLRARPDWVPDEGGLLIDYKTTADASPKAFASSVSKYGYHIQAALYLRAARVAGWDKTRFVFVVQEKTAPFQIAFYELDPSWLMAGIEDLDFALTEYARCVETGDWYGYAQDVIVLEPKPWDLQ